MSRAPSRPAGLRVGLGHVRVEPEVERAPGHQPLTHRPVQETHVEGLHQGDVVVAVLDQVGQSAQSPRSFRHRPRAPLSEAVDSRGDGAIGSGCVAPGHIGQLEAPIEGRAALERLPGRDPLAADEVVDAHRDAADIDAGRLRHPCPPPAPARSAVIARRPPRTGSGGLRDLGAPAYPCAPSHRPWRWTRPPRCRTAGHRHRSEPAPVRQRSCW